MGRYVLERLLLGVLLIGVAGALFAPVVLADAPPSINVMPMMGHVLLANGSNATGASYTVVVFYNGTSTVLDNRSGALPTGESAIFHFRRSINYSGAGDVVLLSVNYSWPVQSNTSNYTLTATDVSNGYAIMPNLTLFDSPPAPIAGVSVQNNATSSGRITLSWSANSEADLSEYLIYVSASNFTSTSGATFNGSTTATSWNVEGLADGTEAWVAVIANDTADNRNTTVIAYNATPLDNVAPGVVTGLDAAAGNTTINLTWTAPANSTDDTTFADLENYLIFSNNTGTWALLNTTSATTYQDTGLTNGASYGYRVSANDTSGNQGANASVAAVPYDAPTITPSQTTPYVTTSGSLIMVASDAALDIVQLNVTNSSGSNLQGYALAASGNTSMSLSANLSLWAEADNTTVFITANDSLGRASNATYYYILDDVAPTVLQISPNATNYTTLNVTFIANVSDTSIDSVWYNITAHWQLESQNSGAITMARSGGEGTYVAGVDLDFTSNLTGPGSHTVYLCANDTFNRVTCTSPLLAELQAVNASQLTDLFQKPGQSMNVTLEDGTASDYLAPVFYNYTLTITQGNKSFAIVGFSINLSQMAAMNDTQVNESPSASIVAAAEASGLNISDFGWFDVESFLPAGSNYKYGVIALPTTYAANYYCNGTAMENASCSAISTCSATVNISSHVSIIGTDSACYEVSGSSTVIYADHFSGAFGASDITSPIVNFTLPLNASYVNSTVNITVAWNITEAYFSSAWLSNGTGNAGGNITLAGQHGQLLLNVSAAGTYTLTIFANDTSGNMGNASVALYVDTTSPNTTASSAGEARWQSAAYNVTISPSDDLQVNLTYYRLDSDSWSNSSASGAGSIVVLINTTGNHSVYYYSVDQAGNAQSTRNITALLDLTAPVPVLVTPANASTSVAVGTIISVFFNETSMNTSVLPSFSVLSLNTSQLWRGNVSWNASNQSIFIPWAWLGYDQLIQVNVTGAKDLAGNTMSPYNWTFATASLDTDGDGNPDYNETDADNDGLNDTGDYLIGNASSINTNVPLNITLNASGNLSEAFGGNLNVTFTADNQTLVQFNYTFTNTTKLVLRNLTFKKDENTSRGGSIIIRGLEAPGKTIYVTNATGAQGVCIKDSPDVQSVADISKDCDGAYETFVVCPGSTGQYACAYNGTRLRITGLNHSGVVQANDTVAPYVQSQDPYTSTNTASVITFQVNENSTCRYETGAGVAYGIMDNYFDTANNISFNATVSTPVSGNYVYYVRCQDWHGNAMTSDYEYNLSVTITSSSSSSSSSAAGGGGGGGGDSAAPTKTSQIWAAIAAGEQKSMTLAIAPIPVSRVEFTPNESVVNGKLTISAIGKPSSLDAPAEPLYHWLHFDTSNMGSFSAVRIYFRVNVTWLNSVGLRNGDVSLYRNVNGAWVELKTVIDAVTDNTVTYYADTPGFSYFAIGKESKATVSLPTQDDGSITAALTPETTSAEQTAVDIGSASGAEVGSASDTAPTNESRGAAQGQSLPALKPRGFLVPLLLLILTSVGAGIVYVRAHPLMQRPKRAMEHHDHPVVQQAQDELARYMLTHLQAGHSLREIRQHLLSHGWHKKDIDHVIKERLLKPQAKPMLEPIAQAQVQPSVAASGTATAPVRSARSRQKSRAR